MKEKVGGIGAFIENKLLPVADKVSRQRHLMALRDGMLAYLPFTIISSIFLIIAFLPIPGYSEFMTNLFNDGGAWVGKLIYVTNSTNDVAAFFVLFATAYSLAKSYNVDKLQASLTALAAFLVVTPYISAEAGTAVPIVKVGAQAMFVAFIVAMVAVEIYRRMEQKGIVIKMPDAVPPAVAKPFASLVPAFVTILVFWIIRVVFEVALNSDLFTTINLIIGKPLLLLGGSLGGFVFALLFEQFLWFFGIHGGSIVSSGAMNPIWAMLQDANRVASIAGEAPINIISTSFRDAFASIGVIGCVIAMVIVAKSKQYKEVGKIGLVPYMFNIGEPVLFGVPLMLNPIYFIPLVITPAVSSLIAYVALAMKLVPIPTGLVQLPWTTPPIISGYLVTGSISGSILQIVLLVVATLIWLPFVKIADKQIYVEEQKREMEMSK